MKMFIACDLDVVCPPRGSCAGDISSVMVGGGNFKRWDPAGGDWVMTSFGGDQCFLSVWVTSGKMG